MSEQDKEVTEVMFRWWRGDVIALMPKQFTDDKGYFCQSYMHVGQHGDANYTMILSESRPATTKEYKTLYQELTDIGYNIKVIPRSPSWSRISQVRREYLKSLADARALKEKEV